MRRNAGVSVPASKGSSRHGFTLIELLVVIAIIALLVAILAPSLDRARQIARKVVCASQESVYGKALYAYIADYGAYPHYAPNNINILNSRGGTLNTIDHRALPIFWAVLERQGIGGTHDVGHWPKGRLDKLGIKAYIQQANQVWDKALCPAMDIKGVMDAMYKSNKPFHAASVGYQWNFTLRSAGLGRIRWPAQLETTWATRDATLWMDWVIRLADGTQGGAQAVSPDEVNKISECAWAWDSWDVGATPNVHHDYNKYGSSVWDTENTETGWHIGPQTDGCNGWAILSNARHLAPGSPNILYADGHVDANATREISESDLGACPSGSWKDIKATSWPDYRTEQGWGTIWHIVPDPTRIIRP